MEFQCSVPSLLVGSPLLILPWLLHTHDCKARQDTLRGSSQALIVRLIIIIMALLGRTHRDLCFYCLGADNEVRNLRSSPNSETWNMCSVLVELSSLTQPDGVVEDAVPEAPRLRCLQHEAQRPEQSDDAHPEGAGRAAADSRCCFRRCLMCVRACLPAEVGRDRGARQWRWTRTRARTRLVFYSGALGSSRQPETCRLTQTSLN